MALALSNQVQSDIAVMLDTPSTADSTIRIDNVAKDNLVIVGVHLTVTDEHGNATPLVLGDM